MSKLYKQGAEDFKKALRLALKKKQKAESASPDEIKACEVCIRMAIREAAKYFAKK